MATQIYQIGIARNTKLAIPLKFANGQDIPMGYLDRLAAIRKRKGFTQVTLAERMGVEQPTIQRWESGKREPNFEQLFQLAGILGVEPGARRAERNMSPLAMVAGLSPTSGARSRT